MGKRVQIHGFYYCQVRADINNQYGVAADYHAMSMWDKSTHRLAAPLLAPLCIDTNVGTIIYS